MFCVKAGKNAYEIMATNAETRVTIVMVEADTLSMIAAIWQAYKMFAPDVIGQLLAYAAHDGPVTVFRDRRLS